MFLVVGLGMDLISRARIDTPLDAALVCLLTLFLFSWGGDPWVRGPAIEGNQIQGLVTDPTGATAAGATIEGDQTDSGHTRILGGALGGYIIHGLPVCPYQLRVSKTGFKTHRLRYNRLGALTMRRNVDRCERPQRFCRAYYGSITVDAILDSGQNVHSEVVQPWRL